MQPFGIEVDGTPRASTESDTSEHSYQLQVRPRNSNDGRNSRGSRGSAGSSPFGSEDIQATPMPRDSLDDGTSARRDVLDGHRAGSLGPNYPRDRNGLASVAEGATSARAGSGRTPSAEVPTPQRSGSVGAPIRRMAAFHDYRQQIGTRSAMSLELPVADQATLRRGVRVSFDMPPTATNADVQRDLPVARELIGRIVRTRRRLPLPWVIGFGIVSSMALCVGLTTLSIGLYNFTKLRANRAQKSIQNLEDDLLPKFNDINASLAAVQVGLDGLAGVLGRRGGP